MLYAIVGMLVIIADQWVKFWVMGHIPLTSTGEAFIPGILSLANVHNEGAAFGILSGSGARIPFIILAGVFALAVIIALATGLISGRFARWCIVLVTAGGVSNCIDRVIYGYVQDMFKLEFINFPVFNLADVFITVFAILFALAVLFGKTRKEVEIEEEFEDDEEDLPKVSRRKQRKNARAAARAEEEDEEEDDEDEVPIAINRRSARGKSRRKAEPVGEPEEKPAPKAQRVRQKAVPAQQTAPAAEEDDPFAGWDRANAKAEAERARRTASLKPAQKTPAAPAAAAPKQAAPAAKPAARPAAKPSPAPAPKKAAAEEEFSLDDILNEFK